MTDYLLRLTGRRALVRFPTARDAYAWLECHAEPGEHYRLSLADGDLRKVTVVQEGIYQRNGDGDAGRGA